MDPAPHLPGLAPVLKGPTGWAAIEELFLASQTNDNTRMAYRARLQRWARWCTRQHLDPLAVELTHAMAYKVELLERYKPSSVGTHRAALAGAYSLAVDAGAITTNPFDSRWLRVKNPRRSSKHQALTKAQGIAVLAAAKRAGPLWHALVFTYLFTGKRVSELLRPDVDDLVVHADGSGTIRGVIVKGGKEEDVHLLAEVVTAIEANLGGRRSGRLLDVGGPTPQARYQRVWRKLDRIGNDAGVRRLLSHDFRMTFISTARAVGVPREDVQAAAGHARSETTQGYERDIGAVTTPVAASVLAYYRDEIGPDGGPAQATLF